MITVVTYLDERAVLSLRTFIQLLLFPVTDVKDPAETKHSCHLHHHQYQLISVNIMPQTRVCDLSQTGVCVCVRDLTQVCVT